MERKFRITVDGIPYLVTVEELPNEDARTALSLPAVPASHPAVSPPAPPPTPAAGGAIPVPAGPASPGERLSPLAGVVASIEVQVGQTVAAGERILTIEAMKMKTSVTAHRAGRIERLLVQVGDGVDAGQPLVIIG